MSSSLFALVLFVALFALGCHAAAPQLRYINSLPQFGDANFTVAIPFNTLFTNVAPSTVTPYATGTTGYWNFFSSYTRLVYAGSDQFGAADNTWYTVFTFQGGANLVKNMLIVDQSTPPTGNRSAVRILNLSQYNYSINATATNSANATVLTWAEVGYASASGYSDVAPGTYYFDWYSATLAKRNVLQNGNNCTPGTPGCHTPHVIKANKSYTYVVMPAAEVVVLDGATSKRSARKRRISKSQALMEKLSNKEENGNLEENNNNNSQAQDAEEIDGAESSEGVQSPQK